jgi:hypothetical protein
MRRGIGGELDALGDIVDIIPDESPSNLSNLEAIQ